MQRDNVTELFGLTGTFPRPGWVVLDAGRDHRFTGELVFETSPRVRVYFDRGHIYLAERLTDPSLGARLVDAGAVSAVQLERGAVRIGEIEHLGRLFERVPVLDRHTVIVTAELMTEECVGWLAVQRVPDVTWTPYRHHESGMHQWTRAPGWVDLEPGDPLPAPPADAPPVSVAPPGRSLADEALRTEPFLDGLIEWDEPAWFDSARLERELLEPLVEPPDEAPPAAPIDDVAPPVDAPPSASAASPDVVPAAEAVDESAEHSVAGNGEPRSADWVDRLVSDGLPDADPFASRTPLPRLPVEPADRFELVWPSGEVDEQFGAVESVVGDGHDPDADRVGSTARLARPVHGAVTRTEPDGHAPEPSPREPVGPIDNEDPSDEVVLAVRRAVASIEVGSLAARQRLVDARSSDPVPGLPTASDGSVDVGVPEPGRVAVRSGRNDWSRRTVTRSVFDEPVVQPEALDDDFVPEPSDHGDRRAGALRRLISSLRGPR